MKNFNDSCYSKIRFYQREALDVIDDYQRSSSKKQALIKLPTGAGKSGVLAMAGNIYDNVLIIAPNSVIPRQLKYEIEEGFWLKIGFTSNVKEVRLIEGEDNIDNDFFMDECIYIITIQKLLSINKTDQNKFKLLSSNIDLVLFDEGHREPAKRWSKANRDLKSKTVLFTATPFRLDGTLFHIDEKFRYSYSITEAISAGFISDIEVRESDYSLNDTDEFAEYLYNIYREKTGKIIARVHDKDVIEDVCRILNNRESGIAVGMHSKITKGDDFLTRGNLIYDLKSNYSIFIHDEMLIEGFDYNDINHVVLHDMFFSSKSLVQQIGRIVRKSSLNDIGYVHAAKNVCDSVKEQWGLYLEFDKDEVDGDVEFTEGKLKRKISFPHNFQNYLSIPKSANVYVSSKSEYHDCKNVISNKIYNKAELLAKMEWEDTKHNNYWILCYEKQTNSKLIKNGIYVDAKLEVVVLYEKEMVSNNYKDYYLFYYDSSGYTLTAMNSGLVEVPLNDMTRLFNEDADIVSTKYTNTNLVQSGASTLVRSGISLNKTSPDLTEKLSLVNYSDGYINVASEDKIKRYINPSRARISDNKRVNYRDYKMWCDGLVNIFEKSTNGNTFFTRFAQPEDKPDCDAQAIMLELNVEMICKSRSFSGLVESQNLEIIKDRFTLSIGSNKIPGEIKYESGGKKRAYLVFDDSKEFEVIEDDLYGVSKKYLLNEFFKYKNFRLYYSRKQVTYYNGIYFKPNIETRFNSISDYSLWDKIEAVEGLSDCTDEKLGVEKTKCTATTKGTKVLTEWPKGSVFNVTCDIIKSNKYANINYMVCDDMNTEIADFIGLDTNKKIIYYIHCKHKDSELSASGLQDLCGQVNKNVEYIMNTDFENLKHLTKHKLRWDEMWKGSWSKKISGKKVEFSREMSRYVIAPPVGAGSTIKKDFYDQYKKLITDAYSKREVWIVTSGLASEDLEKQLTSKKTKKQNEEIPQILWLLQSTQDYLRQINAELKIFCKSRK